MAVIDDIKVLLGRKSHTEKPSEIKKVPRNKVLIVEDDPILREMYTDKFTKEQFNVFTAEDGEKGLEKAKSVKPDIVLLDIMMPIMDGKEMLRKLRQIPEFKILPVIVLTNAGEYDNIKETQHYENAAEFLIKSNISVDGVVQKVKEWI